VHYKHIYSDLYQSLLLAQCFFSKWAEAEIAIYYRRTFGMLTEKDQLVSALRNNLQL